MKYYKARITYGSLKKKKILEKIIWVKTEDHLAVNGVFAVIRKIPFGRWLYIKAIDRDTFIAGVSRSVE